MGLTFFFLYRLFVNRRSLYEFLFEELVRVIQGKLAFTITKAKRKKEPAMYMHTRCRLPAVSNIRV